MPWKVPAMHEVRYAFVQSVVTVGLPAAQAARQFGVSRKTAFKWLARWRDDPEAALSDRSRRPHHSPRRTDERLEQDICQARDQYNWGPRKIRAHLLHRGQAMPSIRTVASILTRHGRIQPRQVEPPPQRFQRDQPNELWQIDHKGPVEVARQKIVPFTVLDDHSRYCLCFDPCPDKTMARAFAILWDLFGEVGLPQAILSDNAFNTTGIEAPGLSWFDSRLIRLGIHPLHGRIYHPQTQGKAERFHGSAVREFIDFNARRDSLRHFTQDAQRWRNLYNTQRPHEALGDQPPVTRWRPSSTSRPRTLPQLEYPPGSIVRKISTCGEISFKGCSILIGRGLCGEHVRIEQHENHIAVFYAWKPVRTLSHEQLVRGRML
jgi:transposase InsO family protein